MMKKLLALMLALLTVGTLAACKKDSGENNKNPDAYKEHEVVYTSVTVGKDIFYFESLDSDSVAITGFKGDTNVHDITIPSTVKTGADESSTRNVTAIADSAFYGAACLRSVTIPEGITAIGNYAFAKCVQLETVSFPSSIATIGDYAFQESGLKELNLPQTCGLTAIGMLTFSACNNLTEVVIPGYIKTIGKGAFFNCTGIQKVTLSEGVETVGDQAFQYNTAMTDLVLPSTFANTNPREDLVFSGNDLLYRDHIIFPEGSNIEDYVDQMVLKTEPVEDEAE